MRKEISQSPAAYFWDLGMRNHALGIFGSIASPAECGFLFQNLVFLLLTAAEPSKADRLHYGRTTDKAEVDFVIEKGREIIPVEVKFKSLKAIETPRSLISFCQKYQPAHAYVVNLGLKADTILSRTRVHFIPYWELVNDPACA